MRYPALKGVRSGGIFDIAGGLPLGDAERERDLSDAFALSKEAFGVLSDRHCTELVV